MKYLLSVLCLFILSCDSGGGITGSSEPPVTIVQMGLSGVESDFSDNTTAQDAFIDDLANELNITNTNRIQILNITNARGSVLIELLFLESSSTDEVSVDSLLEAIVEIEEIGDYGVDSIEFFVSDSMQSADYILSAANAILEDILSEMYACDDYDYDYGYSDCDDFDATDFMPAYDLYIEALSHESTHAGANFGAGLTEMLTITHDPLLEDFFEEWDEWDGGDFFPDNDRVESASFNSGLPLGMNAFLLPKNIDFTSYLPLDYLFKNFVHTYTTEHQEGGRDATIMSDMMDVIDNVFIPRLTNSINYLNNATGENFAFAITPEMQGNADQDPLEMDDTEIHLLIASMHAMRYAFYSISAIDLDIGANDPDELQDFSILEQDSEFLTLRDGKEDYFPNAHADITAMLTSLTAAYDFLANDNDTENDITLWDEVSGQTVELEDGEYVDIDDFIKPEAGGAIYDIFNSNVTVEHCYWGCQTEYWCEMCQEYHCDWYDDEETCIDIEINLGNFMTSPPNNLKNILPDYSITTVIKDGGDWFNDYANAHPTLDLSSCDIDCDWNGDWCENSYYTQWNNGGSEWYLNWGEGLAGCAPIDEYIQELFDNINNTVWENYDPENMDTMYGEPYWNGYLYSHLVENLGNGNYQVDFEYEIYGVSYQNNYEPCIEWDADDFSTWKNQWDTTLGGLLDVDNATFFYDILELDNDDWDKINEDCSEEEGDDF